LFYIYVYCYVVLVSLWGVYSEATDTFPLVDNKGQQTLVQMAMVLYIVLGGKLSNSNEFVN